MQLVSYPDHQWSGYETMVQLAGGAQLIMASPIVDIAFTFNGRKVVIENGSPRQSLNEWIRAQRGYTGTKIMCGEGGCGCCVVAVSTQQHPETTLSINSVRISTLCTHKNN